MLEKAANLCVSVGYILYSIHRERELTKEGHTNFDENTRLIEGSFLPWVKVVCRIEDPSDFYYWSDVNDYYAGI